MESSNTINKELYKVPFNILVCDISNNTNDTDQLMTILLGQKYKKLTTKKLNPNGDEVSYIHHEWNWLFTPTTCKEIITKLTYYSKYNDREMAYTMLLLKTQSISNNNSINDLLDQLELVVANNRPMTVFITDDPKETQQTIDEVIGKRKLDKQSFSLITNSNDNDIPHDKDNDQDNNISRLVKLIYLQLYSKCSYYNELGDEYILPSDINNIEKITHGAQFNQRFNIIVVGRPGCGKSTFINQILGEKRCKVGNGISVSKKIVQYHHSKYPLTLYDTPGFETTQDVNETIKKIDNLNTEFQSQVKQLHLVFFLISSQTRTILKHDTEFLTEFDKWKDKKNQQDIPLVFLLTKTKNKSQGEKMKKILLNDLNYYFPFDNYKAIFPIEMLSIHSSTQPYGIQDLMEWLYNYYYYDLKSVVDKPALLSYEKATSDEEVFNLNKQTYFLKHITSKEAILQSCKLFAWSIIVGSTIIAGCAGFNPCPFIDVLSVVAMQIMMVGLVFYLYKNKTVAKEWIQETSLQQKIMFGSGVGFSLLGNALKFIPVIGTICGGFIDYGVNSITTTTMGYAAIKYCESNFDLVQIIEWSINANKDFNDAIESFKQLRVYFETIETPIIKENKIDYVEQDEFIYDDY